MKTAASISLLCGVLVTLVLASESQAGEGAASKELPQTVTVEVASGRSFTGWVDPRTDEAELWLRWSRGTMAILRPIDWERVVKAQIGGDTVPGVELFNAVAPKKEIVPVGESVEAPRPKVLRVHSAGSAAPRPTKTPRSAPRSEAVAATGAGGRAAPRVRSLEIDAWVANWDGDVEVDGLVVEVRPLDANGAVVPVHGTLAVNLIGCRLGRWTRLVRPTEFGLLGAKYRFPFQAVHPEFDLELAPYAAVHARLSVPGRGVFETTESDVRIRPYSAARDHLQYATDQRFFPLERTGR
ncbi:MAG: hypothetical protein ABIK89_17385 [Planctomycetota bacterium]